MKTTVGPRSILAVLCTIAWAQIPAIAASPPFVIAQGDRTAARDQALTAYASGNAHFRQGELNAASRSLSRAIAAEKQFFATLGAVRRQGESSYLVEYLTMAGVADYRLGHRALAFDRWRAARELYSQYLPRLDGRFVAADVLVERRRCGEAFGAYIVSFAPSDTAVVAVLRAGRAGRWTDAKAADATMRGTPQGDYFAGVIAICTHESRRTVEDALVAALADYTPATSETPNVGPIQASAIRLLGPHSVP